MIANTFALVGGEGPEGYSPRVFTSVIEMRLNGWTEEHALFHAAKICFDTDEPPAIVPIVLCRVLGVPDTSSVENAYVKAPFWGVHVLPSERVDAELVVWKWVDEHRDRRLLHFVHCPDDISISSYRLSAHADRAHAMDCTDPTATLRMIAACGGRFPGTCVWQPTLHGCAGDRLTPAERDFRLSKNHSVVTHVVVDFAQVVRVLHGKTLSGAYVSDVQAEDAWHMAIGQALQDLFQRVTDFKTKVPANDQGFAQVIDAARNAVARFDAESVTSDTCAIVGRHSTLMGADALWLHVTCTPRQADADEWTFTHRLI